MQRRELFRIYLLHHAEAAKLTLFPIVAVMIPIARDKLVVGDQSQVSGDVYGNGNL